ncbi:META domain-containing protein [Salipiger sp. PrR002]|uniref:META domain-containing protein n=1 Tax=Salipiger sp. PrR002 TaxID=2706489 RepID=UPI0013BB45E6|nr:META domain-containing protein [Salipiger sp. PrR002]NDV99743.1 META domain-containing protein [Salipiger sp. PrR002]NDW56659.1 META domain-containing protein [Salipiger sp. PrR004]
MRGLTIMALCLVAGPLAAQELPVHVDLSCDEGAASLTLQGESGTLHFSGAEMPMARVQAASGVKLESIDDPETFVWTKGEDAMMRIVGQDMSNCTVAATSEVTGTPWTLATLDGAPVTDPAPEISFGEDGTLSGSAGCNTFTGTWATEEGMLEIGPLATTRKACEPGVMAQEDAFLAFMGALSDLRFGPEGELQLIADDVTRATATR